MEYNFKISWFKSIAEEQELTLYTNKLNIIFGENSSGKTVLLDSIKWGLGEEGSKENSRQILQKKVWINITH
ncbi:AAA family ATPase (plasmid) [Spiroplasma citri]|uniref:AAA family ATPase n=1 Tax=Spiroplasma citri TaxID=2133 RepID=UPI0013A087FB|nr:AAA family ATPase [Spiroplasma citri]QIA74084.1 AAA family ATPase [Spiroplasma citri]